MANYTYLTPPFLSTTFTSPLAGTNDVIIANVMANFTINGNGGSDVVITGGGNDTITTAAGNDNLNAGNGNNTVNAGGGNNIVTSGSGNDTINTGSGTDIVNSGTGADIINTGAGVDTINSGGGSDIINAGTGNDIITAGAGIDVITGAGGHDTFVYVSLADAVLGADIIADFITTVPSGAGEGDLLRITGLVHDFTGVLSYTLVSLVANGFIHFSAGGGGTVVSFDSNGIVAGGSIGTLVTLVGVAFSSEANSVISLADNIIT